MHDTKPREQHKERRGSDTRANTMAKFDFLLNGTAFELEARLHAHEFHEGHRTALNASQRFLQKMPLLRSAVADPGGTVGEEHKAVRPLAPEANEAVRPVAEEANEQDAALAKEARASVMEATAAAKKAGNLLKGRVPQAQDWMDAWAENTEKLGFHKQERLATKKDASKKGCNLRKVRRKQIRIMAEVRREDIRKQFAEATCISLAMDDRQYQKIIRYRCDAPQEPFVHRGVLCVVSLAKSAVGDFEEDHALMAVRKLDGVLNQFCTPIQTRRQPSETRIELKEHIRKAVKVFAVDGASKERRALELACQELFPNVVLLIRDAAHALRIAIKNPVHLDELFGQVWNELFDKTSRISARRDEFEEMARSFATHPENGPANST